MQPRPFQHPLARAFGAALLATTCFVARPSIADGGESSAAQWVKLGVEDFKRSDYDAARVSFGHAYSVDPKATTLISLALAELQSGHPLEAVRHLRVYVKDAGAEPAKVEAVRSKWLPRAEAQTSRLIIEAPPGAELLVDGDAQGTAPLTDPVDATIGVHEVQARLGSSSESMSVTTASGQVSHVRFGTVVVAPPPAPIVVPIGPAAPAALSLPLLTPVDGSHGPSSAKIGTVIVEGAVAVTAGALGIAFALSSKSDGSLATALRSQLPSDSACTGSSANSYVCASLRQANQSAARDYWLGNGFYIGGGAMVGAVVATWLLWPNERREHAWTLRPSLDGRNVGVLLGGSF